MNDTTDATGTHDAATGAGRPPLRRPRDGKVLAGVAAGIADHLGIDVAIVRLLIVVVTFLTSGFGVIVYLIAIFVIPAADEHEEQQLRAARAARAARSPGGGLGGQDAGFWVGVGLLVIGVLWLFGGVIAPVSVLPFFRPELIWPLVLIGFGLALWRASDRRVAPPGAATPPPRPYGAAARPPQPYGPGGQPPHAPAPHAAEPQASPYRGSAPHASAPQASPYRTSAPHAASPRTSAPHASPPPPAAPADTTAPPVTSPQEPSAPQEPRPTQEDIVTTQQTARLDTAAPGARDRVGDAPGWGEGVAPGGSGQPAGAQPPPPPATGQPAGEGDGWVPPEPPVRSLLTRLTLGAALMTVGVLWMLRMAEVLTIGVTRIVAAALLVTGIGLIVGAWFGRGRWLILVGGLLLPLVILAELMRPYGMLDLPDSTFRGGFGEIVVAPADLTELEARYQLSAGSIRLDLRDLEFDEPTDLHVGVGAGEVVVLLPADVSAEVTARVGVGEHRIDDRTSSGFGVPTGRHQLEVGRGSELLTIDASAGFGVVEIDVTHDVEPVDEPTFDEDGDLSSPAGPGFEPAAHRDAVPVG